MGAGLFLLAKGYTITNAWANANDAQREDIVAGWSSMDEADLADALSQKANSSYVIPGWGAAVLGSGLLTYTFTR